MLVVGAGITGIYQLYRAREAGFLRALLEAGGGVGGTWYWNRYPGARFDSESYTYAYLFSKELFDEWEWQEHFAEQPETERYLNHVVDRFDLRAHIRCDAAVDVGRLRRGVRDLDRRARRRQRAPDPVPRRRRPASSRSRSSRTCRARDDFRGEPHHTGPVADDAGRLRRQARRRHRHGFERRPADPAPSPATLPRSPCTNAPPTGALRSTTHRSPTSEQAQLRADFEAIRETLNTSRERVPPPRARSRRLRRLRGGAAGVLREDVEEPRLLEAHQQLHGPAVRSRGERRVVRVHRREDPQHRQRSRDRGEADPRRPPLRARSGRRSSPGTTRPTTVRTSRSSTSSRRRSCA